MDRGSSGRVLPELDVDSGWGSFLRYEWERLIDGLTGRDAETDIWEGGV